MADLPFEFGHVPPIEDYAFLSDCETTAPVAPDGGVEWMCLPGMDLPSVFGAILDRDGGRFRVNPWVFTFCRASIHPRNLGHRNELVGTRWLAGPSPTSC
jgi:hypothetical protein